MNRHLARLFVLAAVAVGWLSVGSASADGTPSNPTKPSTLATKECGVGACKRKVSVAAVCKPGEPLTENDGWLYAPDPKTGSWDANCDGQVEKKSYEPWMLVTGCRSEEPTREGSCVESTVAAVECGTKWTIIGCRLGKDRKCHGGELKGAIIQACR